MEKLGTTSQMATVNEVIIDTKNKLVSTPCYMMEASLAEINLGISRAVNELINLMGQKKSQ